MSQMILYQLVFIVLIKINLTKAQNSNDILECPRITNLQGSQNKISAMGYIIDSNMFFAIDENLAFTVYDIKTGAVKSQFTKLNNENIPTMAVTALDGTIVSISKNHTKIADYMSRQTYSSLNNQGDNANIGVFNVEVLKLKFPEYAEGVLVFQSNKQNLVSSARLILDNQFFPPQYDFKIEFKLSIFFKVRADPLKFPDEVLSRLAPAAVAFYRDFPIDKIPQFKLLSQRNKINIAITYSTQCYIYGYLIDTQLASSSRDFGDVTPYRLNYEFKNIEFINNTNTLAIHYGKAIQSLQDSSLQYKLCFYNLTFIKPSSTNKYVIDFTDIFALPISCTTFQAQDQTIIMIKNIFFNNKSYTLFAQSSNFVIYNNETLIMNNFQFTNRASFTIPNVAQILSIPFTPIIIIGSTKGKILQLNITNLITTQDINGIVTQQPSYNYQYYGLDFKHLNYNLFINFFFESFGIIFYELISSIKNNQLFQIQDWVSAADIYVQDSKNIYAITDSTETLGIQSQNIVSYDISQSTSSLQKVSYTFYLSVQQTRIFGQNYYYALLSNITYYAAKSSTGQCQTKIQNPNLKIYSTTQVRLFQYYQGQTKYIDLNFYAQNLNFNKLLEMKKFKINQIEYLLLVIYQSNFQYGQNCQMLATAADSSTTSDQYSIQIQIYNALNAVKVFQTKSDFFVISTDNLNYKNTDIDDQGTLGLMFIDKIIFIYPTLAENDNPFSQQYTMSTVILQDLITASNKLTHMQQDVNQLQLINFIPTLNHFFFRISSTTQQFIIFCKYNYNWYNVDNKQLIYTPLSIYPKLSSDDNILKTQAFYVGEKIVYLSYSKMLIISNQEKLYIYKYDDILGELTAHLFYRQPTQIYPIYWIDLYQFNTTYHNQLYAITKNLDIKRLQLKSCGIKPCINQICQKEINMNQKYNSNFIDVFNPDIEGQSTSNVLIRQEELTQEALLYSNLIINFRYMQILMKINLYENSYYKWDQLNYDYKNELSLYSDISILLQFNTIQPLSNNGNTQLKPLKNAKILLNSQYSFETFASINFSNIDWVIQKNNYQNINNSLLEIKVKTFELDNFNMMVVDEQITIIYQFIYEHLLLLIKLYKKNSKYQPVMNDQQLMSSDYLAFNLTQCLSFKIKNTVLSQRQYFNNSFINIYFNPTQIEIYNLTIQNSLFQNHKFLQSTEDISIKSRYFTINKNKILFGAYSQTNFFLQGNVFTYDTLEIKNNIIYNSIFHGPTVANKNKQGEIYNLMFENNKIFSQETKGDVSIILDMSYSSFNQNTSYFNFQNSSIRYNSILYQAYDNSYTEQNLNLKCISNNIDNNTDLFQNSNVIKKKYSNLLFFQIKEILNIYSSNHNITNNGQASIFQIQNVQQLKLYNFNFSDSSICPQEDVGSLLSILDFKKLNLQIFNITVVNKFVKDKSIISIQSLSFDVSDVQDISTIISLTNITMSNIVIQASNSFIKLSAVYLNFQGNLKTQIKKFQVQNILFITPPQVFNQIASILVVDTPTSFTSIQQMLVRNIYSLSPKESIFLNTQDLVLQDSVFLNNQYHSNIQKRRSNGGFIKLIAQNATIQNIKFLQSYSYQGSALQIIPRQEGSFFLIDKCLFEDLVSTKQGGALYIEDITELTVIQIQNCTFKQNLSPSGGSIFVQFFTDENLKNDQKKQLYPKILLNNIISQNTFSTGGEGSFLHSDKLIVEIDTFIIQSNNPKNIVNGTTPFHEKLYNSQLIGTFFQFENSFINISNLNGTNLDMLVPDNITSSINPVFLYLKDESEISLSSLNITNSHYGRDGFILICDSQIVMDNIYLSELKFHESQQSIRALQNTYSDQFGEWQTSSIIIKDKSNFKIQFLTLFNNSCDSNTCIGGALLIKESSGKLNHSTFENNSCSQNGGALAILNPSSQIYLDDLEFINNKSEEKGGSIFISIDKNTEQLIILSGSRLYNNKGKSGGGMYIQNTNEQKQRTSKVVQIQDSYIKSNTAFEMGGGLQYVDIDIQLDESVQIRDNFSYSGFGTDHFSYPKQLKLDLKQTIKSNSNPFQFEKCKDFKGTQSCFRLNMQVSGQTLPNMIFYLIDDQDMYINDQYFSYTKKQITLNIVNEKGDFILPQYSKQFIYNQYFNLTGINIIGLPNQTIQLKLSCPQIQDYKTEEQYFIIIEIYFRQCEQGEIYSQKIDSQNRTTLELYTCQKCPIGTYQLEMPSQYNATQECNKCPLGAQCSGGNEILLNEGYWRIDDQSDRIIYCENKPSNCNGGLNNKTCSQGLIGPLCEICDLENGYTTNGSYECNRCGDISNNSTKIIIAFLFYVFLMFLAVRSVLQKLLQAYKIKKQSSDDKNKNTELLEQSSSIILKQIVSYLQMLLVLSQFGIKMPVLYNKIMDGVADPNNLLLYSMECFYYDIEQEYNISIIYIRILGQLVTPIFFMFSFTIYGMVAYRKYKIMRKTFLVTSYLYTLVYFQPWIFKALINSIKCRKIDGVDYVQSYILEKCYTEDYNYYSFSLILPIILSISVIIPGFIFIMIWIYKNQPLKSKYFNFMIGEYKKDCWYWEFIKMNMKLILMVILTFFEQETQKKSLIVIVVVCSYGWITIYKQPFKLRVYNKIEMTSIKVLICSYVLGFLCFLNKDEFGILITCLIFIIIINIGYIVWVFIKLVKSYNIFFKNLYQKIKMFLIKNQYFKLRCFSKKSKINNLWKLWMGQFILQKKQNKLQFMKRVSAIQSNFDKNQSNIKVDNENMDFQLKLSSYKFIEKINAKDLALAKNKTITNKLHLNHASPLHQVNKPRRLTHELDVEQSHMATELTSCIEKMECPNQIKTASSFKNQKMTYLMNQDQGSDLALNKNKSLQYDFIEEMQSSNIEVTFKSSQMDEKSDKSKSFSTDLNIIEFEEQIQQFEQVRKSISEKCNNLEDIVAGSKKGYEEIMKQFKQMTNCEIVKDQIGNKAQNELSVLSQSTLSQINEHEGEHQSQFQDKIDRMQYQESYITLNINQRQNKE